MLDVHVSERQRKFSIPQRGVTAPDHRRNRALNHVQRSRHRKLPRVHSVIYRWSVLTQQLKDCLLELPRIVFIAQLAQDLESLSGNALEQDAANAAFKSGEGRLKYLAMPGRDAIDDADGIGKVETTKKGGIKPALRLSIRRAGRIARKELAQAAAARGDDHQIVLAGQSDDISQL